MEEGMIEGGSSDEEIEMALKISKAYMGPGTMAFSAILGSAFWGLIISLITSAFLKKEKNIFEAE
jgi:hypothetical protein